MKTDKLLRGDLVVAVKTLDEDGAGVKTGILGVVFEEADYYGDGGGPMVRWFTGGACNVYDGDVAFPEDAPEEYEVSEEKIRC